MSKEAKWGVWGVIIAAFITGAAAIIAALIQRSGGNDENSDSEISRELKEADRMAGFEHKEEK